MRLDLRKQVHFLGAIFLVCIGSFLYSGPVAAVSRYSPRDLFEAILGNDMNLVELILASGVSPNGGKDYPSARGPMADACDGDRVEILKVLLKWKADPNGNRYPPLHSCAYASEEGTRLLLEAGAEPNRAELLNKETPMHQAAKALKLKNIKLLMFYGASVEPLNQRSETPLHLFLKRYRGLPWGTDPTEFVETALFLVQKIKNLDVKDSEGGTVFSYAVAEDAFRQAGVPFALIKAGAKDLTSHAERGRPVDLVLGAFDNPLLEIFLDRKIYPSADAIESATRTSRFDNYNQSVTYEMLLRRSLMKPNHVFVYDSYDSQLKGTLLYLASSVGNVSLLKLLLSSGVDVTLGLVMDQPQRDLETPLLAAVKFSHSEAIKLLVQSDLTKTKKQRYGEALYFSVMHEKAQALRALLENGISPNLSRNEGGAAEACTFFYATSKKLFEHFKLFIDHGVNTSLGCEDDVLYRDQAIVQLSIEAGRDFFDYLLASGYRLQSSPRNIVDAAAGGIYYVEKCLAAGLDVNTVFTWYTPISMAAKVGDLDLVRFLLRSGANVNPDVSTTPLEAAAAYGHEELGLFLLQSGAVPREVQEWAGELYSALSGKHVLLAHEILNRIVTLQVRGNPSFMRLAVGTGDLRLVEKLIALKANLNDLALHDAAFYGREQMVEQLLAAGAHKNWEVDYFGYGRGTWYAPLSLAVMKGHTESVRVLLSYKADVQKGDPLWLAVERDFVDLAALLLAAGVNPNYWKWGTGMTPLHLSITRKQSAMVQALTKYGANPDNEDASGCTTLHYAAAFCSPEITIHLLAKNAKKDSSCRALYPPHTGHGPASITPLYFATRCENFSTLRHLIQAGANPQIDNLGWSPLMSFIESISESSAMHEVIEMVRMLVASGADVNFKGKDGLTALKVANAKQHPGIASLIVELRGLGAEE